MDVIRAQAPLPSESKWLSSFHHSSSQIQRHVLQIEYIFRSICDLLIDYKFSEVAGLLVKLFLLWNHFFTFWLNFWTSRSFTMLKNFSARFSRGINHCSAPAAPFCLYTLSRSRIPANQLTTGGGAPKWRRLPKRHFSAVFSAKRCPKIQASYKIQAYTVITL